MVREGLRSLFAAQSDFDVVGEAQNGPEVLRRVRKSKPAILILDLVMPGLTAEVLRRIGRASSGTKTIVHSMYSSPGHLTTAREGGAVGYVLKGSDAAELVRAVREVRAGREYFDPALDPKRSDDDRDWLPKFRDRHHSLTSREQEVLRLVTEGHSKRAIARRLSISHRTVEAHRANVMRKLHLRSHAELIRYGFERGIVRRD